MCACVCVYICVCVRYHIRKRRAELMRSGVVRSAAVTAVVLAVAAATMTEAGTRHTGAGIARRAAFHERLRAERAELGGAG